MDYKKDMQGKGVGNLTGVNSMNSFNIMLSKKCERLATASYLVTNFLSDTEPLKFRIRTLSIELVRDASLSKVGHSSLIETNIFDVLRANILETLALFELAFVAGLVSEMNFTILKREYASLRDALDVKKASRESHTDGVLGDTFFGTPIRAQMALLDKAKFPQSNSQGHEQKKTSSAVSDSMSDTRKLSAESIRESLISQLHTTRTLKTSKGQIFNIQNAPLKSAQGVTPETNHVQIKTVDQEARRTRILKLIKDNREVSIKDIVAYFPDLSEKTIQRELVSLTESGVLKKTGERRWSRYAVA